MSNMLKIWDRNWGIQTVDPAIITEDMIGTRVDEVTLRNVRINYGLTVKQYMDFCYLQSFACEACKRKCKENPIYVEHDHKTGKVRSLSCRYCNSALGFIDEDPARLEQLAAYICKFPKPTHTYFRLKVDTGSGFLFTVSELGSWTASQRQAIDVGIENAWGAWLVGEIKDSSDNTMWRYTEKDKLMKAVCDARPANIASFSGYRAGYLGKWFQKIDEIEVEDTESKGLLTQLSQSFRMHPEAIFDVQYGGDLVNQTPAEIKRMTRDRDLLESKQERRQEIKTTREANPKPGIVVLTASIGPRNICFDRCWGPFQPFSKNPVPFSSKQFAL